MRHASGMSPLAASAVQPCSQREDDRPKLRLAGALGRAQTGHSRQINMALGERCSQSERRIGR
eukprot:COSAG01_NODE_72206_length_253_cov_1.344156_1_plen_62_part_01